jgi:hypothetical protein
MGPAKSADDDDVVAVLLQIKCWHAPNNPPDEQAVGVPRMAPCPHMEREKKEEVKEGE